MKDNSYVCMTGYFYGNKVSDYGIEHGFVDYRTLAKSFDHILNNSVIDLMKDRGYELVNGSEYNKETEQEYEIFQYYIIDGNGAELLQMFTDEIVYYIEAYDIYVWGVTFYGTSWDYVLTDIPVKIEKERK